MKKSTPLLAGLTAALIVLAGVAPSASATTLETPATSISTFGSDTTSVGDEGYTAAIGDLVYFVRFASNGGTGTAELWYTDGATTTAKIDTFGFISGLVVFKGELYFGAREGVANVGGLYTATATPGSSTLVDSRVRADNNVYPAVSNLVATSTRLYYAVHSYTGSTTMVYSWDGTGPANYGTFAQLPEMRALGDTLFVAGTDSFSRTGLFWLTAITNSFGYSDQITSVNRVEGAGGTTVLLGENASNVFGLWQWKPDGTITKLLEFDDSMDVALLGFENRVFVSGEISNDNYGVWWWDGSTLLKVPHSFEYVSGASVKLGSSAVFYADDGSDYGLWTLDAADLSSGQTPQLGVSELEPASLAVFGNLLLVVDGNSPETLMSWDGTDAPRVVHTATGGDEIQQVIPANGYLLFVTGAYGASQHLWSTQVNPPLSLEATASATPAIAGEPVTITVKGLDVNGSVSDVTAEATFSSVPAAAQTTGNALTFTTAGVYAVTVTVGALTVPVSVTVSPAALDHVVIDTIASGLIAGDAADFTVEGFDSFGNTRGDVTGVATFSTVPDSSTVAGNAVTFAAVHSYAVTADVAGKKDSVTVPVGAGTVQSVGLVASATTVAVGGSITFTVNGMNVNGAVVENLTGSAVLSSDHPSDRIAGNTTVTFPSASPHKITATVGQMKSTVLIQVSPAAASGSAGPGSNSLSFTGFEDGWLGGLAVLLLLAGAGVLVFRRIRTQH